MRILEAQNAVLTNVEVYAFLSDQAKQYQSQKRRGPSNLEMLRGEVGKLSLYLHMSRVTHEDTDAQVFRDISGTSKPEASTI